MQESTKSNQEVSDNHVDDHVDAEIQKCLISMPPQSFFMFAGAGSGKTRSLINTLEFLADEKGKYLSEQGKQIAVITYTNAACDEISRRLQYSPIFQVSTIHSFLWNLIQNFQVDIKQWVETSIQKEISELQSKQSGRSSAQSRDEKIKKKKERLDKIKNIKRFSYNPNGDNVGVDSLSHEEVIKIGAEFISSEETMKQILVSKYPILLIDESQDTKKELIDALLIVYGEKKDQWAIGMFGDTMQKIYQDGKDRLEEVIPMEWARPIKVMNHRSSKRVVALANSIRGLTDDKTQQSRSDAAEGFVRLFIANTNSNKESTEKIVARRMAELTSDLNWLADDGYECLILEHHMAASRFGFANLYTALDECKLFNTALRKGEIAELSFLSNTISPLIKAYKSDDAFEISRLIRKSSPLLSRKSLEINTSTQQEMLEKTEQAATSLFALWDNNAIPLCIDVLKNIQKSGLYELTERTYEILDEKYNGDDPKVTALKKALSVPFDELERYATYVSDKSRFATHQGIKGLEFPRVMVVLDDSESRGFLFSYEKLFGAKSQTATDMKNEKEGKDTSNRRTARLFYVACTRAMDSLAVVAYSADPEIVKRTALHNGWFSEEEIFIIEPQVD